MRTAKDATPFVTLALLAALAMACDDGTARRAELERVREESFKSAYDAAYWPAFDDARRKAYAVTEPKAYEETREGLVANGRFSYDPRVLALVVAVGALLGFLLQYRVVLALRRGGFLVGDIDAFLLPKESRWVDVRMPLAAKPARPVSGASRRAARAVLLGGALLCLAGCETRESVVRAAAVAGREAGARDGKRDGRLAGEARGREAGRRRARADADDGALWEIYPAPLLWAGAAGIAGGLLLQMAALIALRKSAIPETLAIFLVPNLGNSLAYRRWKTTEERLAKARATLRVEELRGRVRLTAIANEHAACAARMSSASTLDELRVERLVELFAGEAQGLVAAAERSHAGGGSKELSTENQRPGTTPEKGDCSS